LFNARFQQGFTGAFQHRGQEGDKALLCLNKPIQPAMPMEKTRRRPTFRGHPLVDTHRWINRYWENENQTFPYRTAETAVQWLEENYLAGPFFLWVDFFDPHEPWDAPEYLVKRYDPDYSGIPMLHPNYGPSAEYTDSELRNLRAHYNAEAELIDRWVGRLLGKLDDLQLWDDTIVLLTTDHGMSLGEHGRTGKSNIHEDDPRFWPLYPEISHVPLMLAGGGIPGGRSANAIVHPADFLPTLCELAEVEANPPKPFDGKSFAAVARGETETHRDFTVAGCFSRGKDGKVPAHCSTPFVVTERWGYTPIGATGKPELFDLEADPLAADNVIGEDPATARDLHALLAEHLKTCQAPGEVVDLWTKSAGSGEGSWSIDY